MQEYNSVCRAAPGSTHVCKIWIEEWTNDWGGGGFLEQQQNWSNWEKEGIGICEHAPRGGGGVTKGTS